PEDHFVTLVRACAGGSGSGNTPGSAQAETAPAGGGPACADIPPALRDHPRYRVVQLLGAGGMGVVYKVRPQGPGRVVARKVTLAGAHAGAQQRLRFRGWRPAPGPGTRG